MNKKEILIELHTDIDQFLDINRKDKNLVTEWQDLANMYNHITELLRNAKKEEQRKALSDEAKVLMIRYKNWKFCSKEQE